MHDSEKIGINGLIRSDEKLANLCGLVSAATNKPDRNKAIHDLGRYIGVGVVTGSLTQAVSSEKLPLHAHEDGEILVGDNPGHRHDALRLDAAGRAAYHAETGDCPEHPAPATLDKDNYMVADWEARQEASEQCFREPTHTLSHILYAGLFVKPRSNGRFGVSDQPEQGINPMPGGTDFASKEDALQAIDVFRAVDGDAPKFWHLLNAIRRERAYIAEDLGVRG